MAFIVGLLKFYLWKTRFIQLVLNVNCRHGLDSSIQKGFIFRIVEIITQVISQFRFGRIEAIHVGTHIPVNAL